MATAATAELRIEDDWKGMFAVFKGDRLVTRTASREEAEAYIERNAGKKVFSSKVAPLEHDSEPVEEAE